jgi:hypothetical protein
MRRVMWVGLGAVAAAFAACGEPGDEAAVRRAEDPRDQRSSLCLSAHGWPSARPRDPHARVDAAAAVIRAGFAPLRARWTTSHRRLVAPGRRRVTWIIEAPAAAVGAGLAPTGDPTVDAVVAAMDVWDFWMGTLAPDAHVATFGSRGAVSADNVAAALAGVPGIEVERFPCEGAGSSSDVIDLGVDATGTRTLEFWIGWGDCLSGCIQSHHWRTTIAPDGTNALIAEWGAPLP